MSYEPADEVKAYLIAHPQLDAFLNGLVRRASVEIADPKEITVEVYKDAEIDYKYLSVTVRQPNYTADIMEKLDSIWSHLVMTMKPDLKKGTVNLMTDFAALRQKRESVLDELTKEAEDLGFYGPKIAPRDE